jgi:hypothetical protein
MASNLLFYLANRGNKMRKTILILAFLFSTSSIANAFEDLNVKNTSKLSVKISKKATVNHKAYSVVTDIESRFTLKELNRHYFRIDRTKKLISKVKNVKELCKAIHISKKSVELTNEGIRLGHKRSSHKEVKELPLLSLGKPIKEMSRKCHERNWKERVSTSQLNLLKEIVLTEVGRLLSETKENMKMISKYFKSPAKTYGEISSSSERISDNGRGLKAWIGDDSDNSYQSITSTFDR